MAKNVFGPLGMSRSEAGDDLGRIIKGRAFSYAPAPGETTGFKTLYGPITVVGDGNIYSTAEDMARWLSNFSKPGKEDVGTVAQMQQVGKLIDAIPLTYAFGLVSKQYRGLKLIEHTGGWAGYRAYVGRFLDQDLGIVLLSNNASFSEEIPMKLAELYLAGQFKKSQAQHAEARPSAPNRIKIDAARLDELSGTYASESIGRLMTHATFFRRGEQFLARFPDEQQRELVPSSDSTFFTKELPLRFAFHRLGTGRFTHLAVSYGDVPSETGGIGISTTTADLAGYPVVTELFAGKPAARDGRIKLGDRIAGIEIEGGRFIDFRGKGLASIPGLTEGPTGSKVRIVVAPKGEDGRKVFELTREAIDLDVARRIEPFSPSGEALAAYAGRYHSPELGTSYRLLAQGAKLVVKLQRGNDIILKPIQQDRFVGSPVFLLTEDFRFQRGPGGRITGFRVSTVGVRNLRFDRAD
jgi:hypothetical protein